MKQVPSPRSAISRRIASVICCLLASASILPAIARRGNGDLTGHGPALRVDGYIIAPLRGARQFAMPAPGTWSRLHAWIGPVSRGAFQPLLLLGVQQTPRNDAHAGDHTLARMVASLKHSSRNLRVGPVLHTAVGGLPAARQVYSATDTVDGRNLPVHGVAYAIVDGPSLITVTATASPDDGRTLGTLDEAIRGIRRA